MTSLRPALAVLFGIGLGAGCYQQQPQFATMPEPVQVAGPPGGAMDPAYQQGGYAPQGYAQAPQYDPNAAYPQSDPNLADPNQDPNPQYADPGAAGEDPEAQPIDPNASEYTDPSATAPVTDADIDGTLDAYGTWEEDPDYGRVWQPDTTVVGVDFTPYETCGSWAWTAYGWSFNCDWSWGWLPFHYGRWGWFNGHWGWVPGHHWGPGWVQWRNGGGYVGWRPLAPVHNGVAMPMHDAHWRFTAEGDLGKTNIRAHEFRDPAEGLRVTSAVARPAVRGTSMTRLTSVMGQRPSVAARYGGSVGATRTPVGGTGFRAPAREPVTVYRAPPSTYRQPSYRPTLPPSYRPAMPSYRQPTYRGGGQVWHAPPTSHPVWSSPSRPSGGSSGGFHSSGSSGGGFHSSGSSGGFHSSGGGGFHSSGGGGGGGHHR
ncbi:MAG TPA: DUF6600 domain-containing protein [Kofleriaceae bacterium]|nr:DUF6600 domain-containing protein [Kofleriaceae bacterium]